MANSSIYNYWFGKNKKSMKGGSMEFDGHHLLNLIMQKRTFLILIFSNLIVQLGITYYVMNKTNNPELGVWLLFILQLIIIYLLALVPMPPIIKFFLFSIFSWMSGIMLSHLKTSYDQELINIAIKGALSIFGFMFAFSVALVGFNIYLGYKVGVFLFWALLALIIATIVNMVGPQLSIVKRSKL